MICRWLSRWQARIMHIMQLAMLFLKKVLLLLQISAGVATARKAPQRAAPVAAWTRRRIDAGRSSSLRGHHHALGPVSTGKLDLFLTIHLHVNTLTDWSHSNTDLTCWLYHLPNLLYHFSTATLSYLGSYTTYLASYTTYLATLLYLASYNSYLASYNLT